MKMMVGSCFYVPPYTLFAGIGEETHSLQASMEVFG
jgi:hypothetical protein